MAMAIRNVQRSDGFWNVSLLDDSNYPGPETSGTALFTYGMALGIAEGWLDGREAELVQRHVVGDEDEKYRLHRSGALLQSSPHSNRRWGWFLFLGAKEC